MKMADVVDEYYCWTEIFLEIAFDKRTDVDHITEEAFCVWLVAVILQLTLENIDPVVTEVDSILVIPEIISGRDINGQVEVVFY